LSVAHLAANERVQEILRTEELERHAAILQDGQDPTEERRCLERNCGNVELPSLGPRRGPDSEPDTVLTPLNASVPQKMLEGGGGSRATHDRSSEAETLLALATTY
jgi:hypothetical protein